MASQGFALAASIPVSYPLAMAAEEKDLFKTFEEMGIPYTLYRHEPFFTVEESKKAREGWPGGHCKCLFLKDKKDNMVLAIAHEDARVDLKALAKTLGLGRFSFGNETLLKRVLDVTPGAVNPFSVMNLGNLEDNETFRVVVDQSLEKFDTVHFHPLHNEATVGISFPDLIRFLNHFGHPPKILHFG